MDIILGKGIIDDDIIDTIEELDTEIFAELGHDF